jgi:hypothetical protein
MLGCSVGFQGLFVSHCAADWLDKSKELSRLDFYFVERALHHCDEDEGLRRGSLKRQLQNLSLSVFWAFFT